MEFTGLIKQLDELRLLVLHSALILFAIYMTIRFLSGWRPVFLDQPAEQFGWALLLASLWCVRVDALKNMPLVAAFFLTGVIFAFSERVKSIDLPSGMSVDLREGGQNDE